MDWESADCARNGGENGKDIGTVEGKGANKMDGAKEMEGERERGKGEKEGEGKERERDCDKESGFTDRGASTEVNSPPSKRVKPNPPVGVNSAAVDNHYSQQTRKF